MSRTRSGTTRSASGSRTAPTRVSIHATTRSISFARSLDTPRQTSTCRPTCMCASISSCKTSTVWSAKRPRPGGCSRRGARVRQSTLRRPGIRSRLLVRSTVTSRAPIRYPESLVGNGVQGIRVAMMSSAAHFSPRWASAVRRASSSSRKLASESDIVRASHSTYVACVIATNRNVVCGSPVDLARGVPAGRSTTCSVSIHDRTAEQRAATG